MQVSNEVYSYPPTFSDLDYYRKQASELDKENRILKKELDDARGKAGWTNAISDSLTQENLSLKEQVATLIRVLGSKA
jgi:hypothetical protein